VFPDLSQPSTRISSLPHQRRLGQAPAAEVETGAQSALLAAVGAKRSRGAARVSAEVVGVGEDSVAAAGDGDRGLREGDVGKLLEVDTDAAVGSGGTAVEDEADSLTLHLGYQVGKAFAGFAKVDRASEGFGGHRTREANRAEARVRGTAVDGEVARTEGAEVVEVEELAGGQAEGGGGDAGFAWAAAYNRPQRRVGVAGTGREVERELRAEGQC